MQAAALLVLALSGCSSRPRATAHSASEASAIQVWGSRGTKGGEFFEPRAISIAPNGFAYLVDSSGRIQKWTTQGKFIKAWQAPSTSKGRPEGVAVHPNGDIYITDTHYSRIRVYTPDGKLKKSFGHYGTDRGGFLLVTGIAIDKAGFVYAADYGGDWDRVSKWTKDGTLVASWNGHGSGPRQFRRPCGLALSIEGDLLVADIANHRVQRLDRNTGVCKSASALGPPGEASGQLTYPYGVAVDTEGSIYTVEYSTHRACVLFLYLYEPRLQPHSRSLPHRAQRCQFDRRNGAQLGAQIRLEGRVRRAGAAPNPARWHGVALRLRLRAADSGRRWRFD